MRKLKFRVLPSYNDAPPGGTKKRILFLLVILISTIAILIPDISFAGSAKRLKRDAQEAEQIEKFKENVKREGDTLFLKSKSGTDISLKNSAGCEHDDYCFSFIFLDYFEDVGFFLVRNYNSKGDEFMMVSESDRGKYLIHEFPIFSPDKRRFFTIIDDTDAEYDETEVFIWRIENDKLIPEFSRKSGRDSVYSFIGWKNNLQIDLEERVTVSKEACQGQNSMLLYIDLKREPYGWRMYKTFSPGTLDCDPYY